MSIDSIPPTPLRRVAVVGNHVPRLCGIATFTSDLVEALTREDPEADYWAVAMNDEPGAYEYPERVRFEIEQTRLGDYRLAASFLKMNQVDVACLQHEYGIYGGDAGRHVLQLIGELRVPVVTTLHTVLKEPTPAQLSVTQELGRLSDRLVVMSKVAGEFLGEIYGVPEEKIVMIHHGIPDVAFVDPSYHKDRFALEGKKVVLTFGLLSPNKGIEHMVRALPAVVKEHPDVVYVVCGVTHPQVKRTDGETYRQGLGELAGDLGVAENVVFLDRFVDQEELNALLGAADIYVTPYANEAQVVSGTLAYAMGSGKAIVSTPYWYAAEMLAEGRGRLVPVGDAEALASQVLDLLDNPVERHAMRKRAYLFTREAVWGQVARRYLEVFAEARENRSRRTGISFSQMASGVATEDVGLPEINLDHLRRLTDDTGILQHAKFNVPDLMHGYCTDDVARALIVTALIGELLPADRVVHSLRNRYLSFLNYAFDEETRRFRNFMTYDRCWAEGPHSEDSHGRAIWGLGIAMRRTVDSGQLAMATTLFNRAAPTAEELKYPRSWALALIGIDAYLQKFPGDSGVKRIRQRLAERLLQEFQAHATDDHPWFEEAVTYDNGKLPHALLIAGEKLERDDMVRMGLRALEWLVDIQTENGCFAPIGNCGWYTRGGGRARFDQQPIEAQSMIDACIAANRVTGDEKWLDAAARAFQWFLGRNDLNVALCDLRTGACHDGLQPDGVNLNQGAESTLAWLISLAQMHKLEARVPAQGSVRETAEPKTAVTTAEPKAAAGRGSR